MASDISFLPREIGEMVENYGTSLRLALVEELEAEHAIFVQDGNHGEYRPQQNEFVSSGVPFVRPGNLVDGRIDLSGCDQINEVAFNRVRKGIGKGGDIVLTTNATIGRIAITPKDAPVFVTNPQTTVWRSTDSEVLDQYYLFCFMRSAGFQDQLRMHTGRNATFDYISLTKQRSLSIPLPPLIDQIKIARILGALDDKIELNSRMNSTLEAMARVLFQSWFVNFDPVKRNAADLITRPEDSLFPVSFEDSVLGDIPSGWNVTTLGDVLDVLETGRRPKGGVAGYSSGIPSVGAESIWGIGKFDYSKTKYVPTEFYEKTSAGRVGHNDVLLYKDGGKPGEFRPRVGLFGHGFPFDKFCINEHVFRMRSGSVGQIFLYFAVSDQRILDDFANKGGKAAIPGINQVDVRSTRILMPDKRVLEEFNRQVTPWCDLMIQNAIQSRTLSNLRDALLPKLLSGEICLKK